MHVISYDFANSSSEEQTSSSISLRTSSSSDNSEHALECDDCDSQEMIEKSLFELQDTYYFVKRLSIGRKRAVYMARERQTGLDVVLRFSDLPLESKMLSMAKNVENIEQLLTTFVLKESICSVTRFVEAKHSVFDFETLDECVSFFLSMSKVVAALNDRNIVHMDIKTSNVLWDGKVATLIDFDLATTLPSKSKCIGTMGFIAPELEHADQHPIETTILFDSFSLGVLFYQVLCKVPERKVKPPYVVPQTAFGDAQICKVTKGLLSKEPKNRLTAREAFQMLDRYFYGDFPQETCDP